ncbi:DUF3410 domain-containing protein, partial [Citrobacter freundii]|uniref:DUF3410 domain-containing protein n=2 Tax=Gammaproteobacteria TaxID=1236 RepID=UPI0021C9A1CE
GNVGKRLAYMAQLLGWNVIGFDPFVQLDSIKNVSLETLLQQANAVSIHVPLTKNAEHATYHLFDEKAFAALQPNTILINSARGPVVKESALIEDIQRTQRKVVLDVFEHEPVISEELIEMLALATPHIAGYSLEGKARGTQMIYEAFCQKFGFDINKRFETQLPTCEDYFSGNDLKAVLKQKLTQIYDIAQDDANIRACIKEGKVEQKAFDLLRKNYPLRREWAAHGGPQA